LSEELLRSTFLEMFGDPGTNRKCWRRILFAHLLKTGMRNGISPSSEGRWCGKVLILSALTGAAFDNEQVKEARFASPFTPDQMVSTQDFLICRGNGNRSLVGCGRFPTSSLQDTAFPDTMIAAAVDSCKVEPLFLEKLWSTGFVRRQIENGARTTNGTHKINQKVLASIELPVPPMSAQKRFAAVAAKLGLAHREAAAELSTVLFDALVQRAFRGEL
jgi:type I restriction enzyme S subunit